MKNFVQVTFLKTGPGYEFLSTMAKGRRMQAKKLASALKKVIVWAISHVYKNRKIISL